MHVLRIVSSNRNFYRMKMISY